MNKLTKLKDVDWPNTRIHSAITNYFRARYKGTTLEDLTIRDLLQVNPERMWNMGKKSEMLLKDYLAKYGIFYQPELKEVSK